MDDFAVLLDSPTEATKRYQIAALGDYEHGTYGKFSITEPEVRNWQANLAHLPGGRALIDLDHRSERAPRNSEAAGWITGVDLEGDKVMANIDWTPIGEQAVKDRRYQFFSPVYGQYKDQAGTAYEDTLMSAALTNKPALTGLPVISLASPERVQAALGPVILTVSETPVVTRVDSPAPMSDLLKLLDLPEDADEQTVLDAITGLKEKADTPAPEAPEVKTLEQQAKDEGKIILDSDEYGQLRAGAAAGIESKKQLDELTLDTAFTKALEAGKAVAADREFYESLPLDLAVKRLDEAPQIVNVKPIGKNITTDHLDQAPPGFVPDAYLLDQEVKQHMAENNMASETYVEALHQVEDKHRTVNV